MLPEIQDEASVPQTPPCLLSPWDGMLVGIAPNAGLSQKTSEQYPFVH